MSINARKFVLVAIVSIIISAIGTIWLYWPIYQKILLSNPQPDITSKINNLQSTLDPDIRKYLESLKIYLPIDRHILCLKNHNSVYLRHADSDIPGMPYRFYTGDISQQEAAKKDRVGAMAIDLYYKDSTAKDSLYREIGQPEQCLILDAHKLEAYASSTVTYHHTGISQLNQLDLGEQGKVNLLRSIVGGSMIDTKPSSAYISARWGRAVMTLLGIFVLVFAILNKLADLLLPQHLNQRKL